MQVHLGIARPRSQPELNDACHPSKSLSDITYSQEGSPSDTVQVPWTYLPSGTGISIVVAARFADLFPMQSHLHWYRFRRSTFDYGCG